MSGKMRFLGPLLIAFSLLTPVFSTITVSSTILVLARDNASSYTPTSGLNAHGIPYQVVLVPSTGVTLPTLNSSTTNGNYGGIIVMSEVSYQYNTSFNSALTPTQWQTLYDYQIEFGVRMVRLDVYPDADFGVETAILGQGCCTTGVEQLISFTDTSTFPTANIVEGAGVSSQGLWHYPATILNSTLATEIAQFAPGGSFSTATTAAIINNFADRQQMVWFTSWATDWSQTSNFLIHAHIHWMTRGLFVGQRRVYFNTQVDDVHLATYLYQPTDGRFRLRPSDLDALVAWQANINTRLPAGSAYVIELGHSGNGNVEWAINNDTAGICSPNSMISYDAPDDTALEFQKVLGTGTNLWPTTPTSYKWTLKCVTLDNLVDWFMVTKNRDAFAHISHTFSHENLDNATYSDAVKEIQFNQAWLKQVGLSAGKFSPKGLIPPAITGLHNGDAIKAWMDNGVKNAVGDNSRPVLLNPNNEYWPLITNVAANGYAGLTVIPRWSLPIYYNCDMPNCTLNEWVNTSHRLGDFQSLLDFSRTSFTRALLALRHDGFMFHQANLRNGDTPTFTVGSQTGNFSLLQTFVETVLQEMIRLTTWPIISIQHDNLGVAFTNRMALDNCNPNLSYLLSDDTKTITGVTLTATKNTCTVPIPVQFPGPISTSADTSTYNPEQIGSDPLTIWTKLSGKAVTYTLASPIAI